MPPPLAPSFALQFKPFTIRQDIVKQANVVAEALADAFEVRKHAP
jgi:hypothetical protein